MGGNIANKILEWKKLTSDREILGIVEGLKIEFINPPSVDNIPVQYGTSFEEHQILEREIQKLISQRVIVPCDRESGQVTSPIFLREKSDKSQHLILNLKSLNKGL